MRNEATNLDPISDDGIYRRAAAEGLFLSALLLGGFGCLVTLARLIGWL